jgi:hypothetical protein
MGRKIFAARGLSPRIAHAVEQLGVNCIWKAAMASVVPVASCPLMTASAMMSLFPATPDRPSRRPAHHITYLFLIAVAFSHFTCHQEEKFCVCA